MNGDMRQRYSSIFYDIHLKKIWGGRRILVWSKCRLGYYWVLFDANDECDIRFTLTRGILSLYHSLTNKWREAWAAERVVTEYSQWFDFIFAYFIDKFSQTTKNRLIGLGTITNMTLIWWQWQQYIVIEQTPLPHF